MSIPTFVWFGTHYTYSEHQIMSTPTFVWLGIHHSEDNGLGEVGRGGGGQQGGIGHWMDGVGEHSQGSTVTQLQHHRVGPHIERPQDVIVRSITSLEAELAHALSWKGAKKKE